VVLDQLKKGRVKIEFEHVGLEPIRKTLPLVANRLALALVISALVIASALMVFAGVSPKIGDISIIGIVGLFVAAILAVGLLVSMILRK
jgi:ubiquinone biosynthesis protein